MVNTDNRLIASSHGDLSEPLADKVASPMQRGFLQGRSIIRKAREIDHASILASLEERNAALILFDFETAFPSISQDFILAALEAIDVPPFICNVVRCRYKDSMCNIKLQRANV